MSDHEQPIKHEAPLQQEVAVELTDTPSKHYRENAAAVHAIVKLTEARDRMQKLAETAHLDPITGLPNRARFDSDAEALVERARKSGKRLGLALLDGDRFKKVNDEFGHATGDNVLRLIGKGLEAGVRPTDRVYRIGGDEFAILMPDYGADAESAEEINELNKDTIERLEGGVESRVIEAGFEEEYRVGVSVGIVVVEPGDDFLERYQAADAVMFQNKAAKRAPGDPIR